MDAAVISGNLTSTVSDHLPQFLIMPLKNNSIPKQHNIFIRDIKKMNEDKLITEIRNVNWDNLLDIRRNDLIHSFDKFMTTINNIIDKHAPLRKANKKELKLRQKPWITLSIIRSIKERDKTFRKIKNTTSPITKANLQKKHRTYRNLIVTLVRLSKKNHTSDYFANNIKNIRKTWEGIRKIVSLYENTNFVPNCLLFEGTNITHPEKIANRFNNFFSSVGKQIQNQVHSNHINFSTFLKNPSENSLFLTPTDTEEVSCIISSFKSNIATGPNSIPTTILKKIQKYICSSRVSHKHFLRK